MKQITFAVVLTALLVSACTDRSGPRGHKSPAPARVEGGTSEGNAARLTLTAAATARLGITTAPVERRALRSWRLIAADVVLPPGARTTVAAPMAARVARPTGGLPRALDAVDRDATVLLLAPLLTPEREIETPPERLDETLKTLDVAARRLDADRALEAARIRLEATQVEVTRATRLARDDVGSARRLEDAATAERLAAVEVDTAERRVALLVAVERPEPPREGPTAIPVLAPRAGLLEDVFVREGQLVPAGAPLFAVIDLRTVWVRVPIYAGELGGLDLAAPARIEAAPVKAPLGAPTTAATIDLFYALEVGERPYRPGERLLARIPKRGAAESLVVPWSALLFDASGGAWVYVREAADTFRRVGILPTRRDGDLAVLERGPAPGVEVVVAGAAELFGTEFGTGK